MDVWNILHQQQGVISYNSCPHELFGVLRRMAQAGDLASVLPGIFAPADQVAEPLTRMRAAALRDPNVVFTDLTAAHLLWDVPIQGPISASGRLSSNRPRFRFSERAVDPAWVIERGGFRCTNHALTAVDLIPTEGGTYVDRVLRDAFSEGALALEQMWAAFEAHPHRPGNIARTQILSDSRDRPWSEAERRVHRQLREAHIEGWKTNYEVVATSGRRMFIDVALPELEIALEVDGFGAHSAPDVFHTDRARQNDLVVDLWTVLRVTWDMIESESWLHWLETAISAREWPWQPAHKAKHSARVR
ncbi:hypothetical protein AADG42_16490 [Ammonicoccus fulvus]|uniref:DUF559 domain-containing protein n=1 Tax=Ammonicoccus fulvus TaxID=3138240 RepID=A0ABZ3FVK8_9ACTN